MYDPQHPTVSDEEMYDPQHPTVSDEEMYDPQHPTVSDEEMYDPQHPTTSADQAYDAGQAGMEPQPAAVDWNTYWANLWAWEGLNIDNDRIQEMRSCAYLWHNSRPYDYLDPATLEFIQWGNDSRLGIYYRNADRFLMQSPQINEIWLVGSPGSYHVDRVSTSEPDYGVECIYVPWEHLAQHMYEYCDLTAKEKHSFWPWQTTENDVLDLLVNALNNGGSVAADGATAYVVYDDNDDVKTFFLARPDDHDDVYTAAEMDDIGSTFRGA
jgi:hypothetical protein